MINIFLILIYLFPFLAIAQGDANNAVRIINAGTNMIIIVLIPLAFGLATLYFFWGMVKYIKSAGSEKDEGRQIMIWGVVALFIAFSIWGIMSFIRTELGIEDIQNVDKPTIYSVDSNVYNYQVLEN